MGSLSSVTRTVWRMASHSFSTAALVRSPGKTFLAHFFEGTAMMHHWYLLSKASW